MVDALFVDPATGIPYTELPVTDAATHTGLGTDGAAPPALTGTGIRGWLRGIYERLGGNLAVTGPLTDVQLRATALPISGSVTVSDGAGPLTVDGTVNVGNLPATQPVSGTVAVSNLPGTQPVSGTVSVGNFPASTEIANDVGNPVPVSGTVTVSNPTSPGLTDTQLRATPIAVDTELSAAGPLSIESTQVAIRSDLDERFSGGKLAVATTLTTAGDNTVITPTAGKALRVMWVSAIPSSDNTAANLIQFKFGAGGAPFYIAYAIAHWEPFQAAVNVPLVVNCQTAEKVSITAHYREI